jgi:cytochrome b561
MLFRVAWRVVSTVPPPPTNLPAPLRLLSRATHFLLYALLIALPLLGWINANARGWDVRLFAVVPLPALASPGAPWGRAMGDIHQIAAWLLLGVAGLHVAGALYHQFVLRDGLLRRIGPG